MRKGTIALRNKGRKKTYDRNCFCCIFESLPPSPIFINFFQLRICTRHLPCSTQRNEVRLEKRRAGKSRRWQWNRDNEMADRARTAQTGKRTENGLQQDFYVR